MWTRADARVKSHAKQTAWLEGLGIQGGGERTGRFGSGTIDTFGLLFLRLESPEGMLACGASFPTSPARSAARDALVLLALRPPLILHYGRGLCPQLSAHAMATQRE